MRHHWYIYFAVTVSGASVLAVEILGTRIIGPFYGVSLYLWSALIGVTLAALSLGYALGGRWADRGPTLGRFCALLAAAGLWIIAIPWMRYPVLSAGEVLGLRAAVLAAATVMFFPPLALLGMVSPYAIRLKVSRMEEVGRTAGNLYAISTIASVVAAIGTGFFLIPNVGVSRLTVVIGIALCLTAVLGALVLRRRVATVALIPLIALAGWLAPSERADADDGLLAIMQSAYAEIRVVEREGLRYMLIDGGVHTMVDPQTWEPRFPYVDVLDITKQFYEQPGRLILVGLGGGSVVKRFAGDGWRVDAVEIDPVVSEVAEDFFGLRPSEARLYHQDGREFFIRSADTYDLVIMDAFGSSSIPFHLVTKEAFALIRSRLAPGSLMAMNIEAVGWDDVLVHSLLVTLGEVFTHALALPMAEPPNEIGNLILLASDREIELDRDLPIPHDRSTAEYHRLHAWENRFSADPTRGRVLTDDLNPSDVWAERINLVARRNLHDYFGSAGIGW